VIDSPQSHSRTRAGIRPLMGVMTATEYIVACLVLVVITTEGVSLSPLLCMDSSARCAW
jgi:hypothetical protein